MSTSITSSVYIHVIKDVVNKVRDEFLTSDGPGESVLNEIQALWETKMIQAGAILAPVHNHNVPNEWIEVFEMPSADLPFPLTPLLEMAHTLVPGTDGSSMYKIPTGGSDYATPQDTGGSNELNKRVTNQPNTQDLCTMPAAKRRRDDSNPNYHNGGGNIAQQDGASGFEDIPNRLADAPSKGVVSEDYNIANTPATVQNDNGDTDDEEPLNEKDDEDLDDIDDGKELNIQQLVLALFDKVSRTKNRWRCTLKYGIMDINNKDILFNTATGDFNF